jgi:predicted nuclease of restriction endonuclease-like RecB superfamily
LRALLDEHARFAGRRRSELRARLQEPLPVTAPKAKLRFASQLLDSLLEERTKAAIPPREARAAVFRAAVARPFERASLFAACSAGLGVGRDDLEAALFADLASERRVGALPDHLNPHRLALETNLALVNALLRRASRMRIRAWGNTRALVRHARLVGLICRVQRIAPALESTIPQADSLDVVEPDQNRDGVVLEVSGPFALFRNTELYGRAFTGLLPRAAWCNRFELEAECTLNRGTRAATLVLQSGDPLPAGRELSRHDSRLEERFERDFKRAAPAWDVVREPHPIDAAGTLIFPDFELIHRRNPAHRFLLEIVGFWTPEYLTEKLERLRRANIERLILCIDERRRCVDADLPAHASVVRFKGKIDPRAILEIVRREVGE